MKYPSPRVDRWGTVQWTNSNGSLHRDDGPAMIFRDGTMYWYKNGRAHRGDGKPAVISFDGSMMWYEDGKYCREGGPPVILDDGSPVWHTISWSHIPRVR
jgi:hypothetical protein